MLTLSTTSRFLGGLFILIAAAYGCGKSDTNNGDGAKEISIIDSATLVTYHPMLDAKVRPGDSMLYDLTSLIDEGIIVEADMKIIGMYVSRRGGIERTDSVLTGMTYRQLLDRALTQDMSRGAVPCDGCVDSILIFIPGNSQRIYIGKGRRSLQAMIRKAVQETDDVPSDYEKPPLNQPVDTANWQEMVRTSMHGREDIDWVLFGNTMILLGRDGKKISDYTYGRILAIVDEVKEMDEFEDVHRLFERTKKQKTLP